jgi:hypothetical protein
MANSHPETSHLCYLDASKVTLPAGVLSELNLLSPDGEPLGNIEGVVIEAAARRVRYFDVRSAGWLRRRRYLVPADHLAQLERERKALRLLVDLDENDARDLDTKTLREFSDEDLLDFMFRSRAA